VEVKIGIAESNRELVIASDQTPEQVQEQVTAALADPAGVLTLEDDKGRRYVVPTGRIGYVEIGAGTARPVGFLK